MIWHYFTLVVIILVSLVYYFMSILIFKRVNSSYPYSTIVLGHGPFNGIAGVKYASST